MAVERSLVKATFLIRLRIEWIIFNDIARNSNQSTINMTYFANGFTDFFSLDGRHCMRQREA